MVHEHLAESKSEYGFTIEQFGCSPVEWFRRNNLLGDRFYYAHCIHLDEQDIKVLAETGTGVVSCPISNMYLSSGSCQVRNMMDAGVERIGLGVDGAASSNSSNMMEEMRVAYLLNRLTHEENACTSEDILYMATSGGAKTLGRNDIGTLVPGKAADLTLLDWTSLSYAGGRNDPADCIVLSGDARMVDTVIVNGEIVVEKGRLLRIDEWQKRAYADEIGHELLQRASKHFISAYGITLAMYAGFGSATLAVLWQGVSKVTGMSIGMTSFVIAVVMIVFVWFYDRPQIHIGTVLYQVVYSGFVEIFSRIQRYSDIVWINFLLMCIGIILFAVGTGIYASANLGRGSYEAVTFSLAGKNGWPVKIVRMTLDVAMVVIGVLFGGSFGICTIITVLISGPIIQATVQQMNKFVFGGK